MPKSALTGREKKTKRIALKGAREREKASIPSYIAAQKGLTDIGQGAGALETDTGKLAQAMQATSGLANQYFEPHKQQAMAEFNQYQAPEIRNQGAGAGSRTSALNQALAAAAGNLHRQLASDYSGLSLGLGQDLLNRQERGQQFNQQSRLSALQSGLQGQGGLLSNVGTQASYLPKSPSSNRGQAAAGGALQGALTGFSVGGPWGALAGGVLGGGAGFLGAGQSSGQMVGQAGGIAQNFLENRSFNQAGNNALSNLKWGA